MDKFRQYFKNFGVLALVLFVGGWFLIPSLSASAEPIRHVDLQITEPPTSDSQGYMVVERNDVNTDGAFQYDVYFWSVASKSGNVKQDVFMDITIRRNYITFSPRILDADGGLESLFVLSKFSDGQFSVLYSGTLTSRTIDYYNTEPYHIVYGAYAYGNIGGFNYSGFADDGVIADFGFNFGNTSIPDVYLTGGFDVDELLDNVWENSDILGDIAGRTEAILNGKFDSIELPSGFVDDDSITVYGDFLNVVFRNDYVMSMLVLVFSVAMISFIVFGKKG